MNWLRVTSAALFLLAATPVASQDGGVDLTLSDSTEAFQEAFCAADRSAAHIFVVPLAMFDDGAALACDFGEATMRIREPLDDPGHVVLNIDPPADVADGLDCDGKADVGMEEVAINCLPADAEAADHRKP